jgi:hypothetical protein
VLEIGLGTHDLPNEPRLCWQHGVDTRSVYVKIWAEVKHPTIDMIKNDVINCAKSAATAGAAAAISTFEAAFYSCVKSKLGQTVASNTSVSLKWKTKRTDWSGH